MKSRWFILSVMSGILCFGLSLYSIEYKIEYFTVSIPWAVLFPVITSLAYGIRGALVAGISGAMWFPALLWPENQWGLISNFISYILLYITLGYIAVRKYNTLASKRAAVVLSVVFYIVMYLFLYLVVFKWLLSYAGVSFPYSGIFVIIIKSLISFSFIIIFGESLLHINPVRKLLKIEIIPYGKNNLKLFINSFCVSILVWLSFYWLDRLLISSDNKKDYIPLLFLILILSTGVIVRWLMYASEKQIKAELSLLKFKNHLEELVQVRTQQLEETITNLKTTQETLYQADKMASLGTLTAGVAHEINNPLNYISGAYLGLDNYFKDHESKDTRRTNLYLNSIKEGIDRTTNIVKGLTQFSRDNSAYDEDCNIHSIIDNCLLMLHNQIKHIVKIEKHYSSGLIIIKGNVGKLHQVILNVLTNARQAINGEGVIRIKTQKEPDNIKITISDTGCGIDKKSIKRIIDPFFTTKPPGEGTGLGLSISYSIIKKHKGTIEFESEINKGTSVIIKLPN